MAAMTQALVDLRREHGTFGPVLPEELKGKPLGPVVMGKDVRFASDLAQETAVEVFAGNSMKVLLHRGGRSTPTPVVSHAILSRVAQGEIGYQGRKQNIWAGGFFFLGSSIKVA
ncbi:MAG: hypothetical protein GX050_01035 [Firmicutes bacterium]|nr:hypothetical protein [Bacillota bacterium]